MLVVRGPMVEGVAVLNATVKKSLKSSSCWWPKAAAYRHG